MLLCSTKPSKTCNGFYNHKHPLHTGGPTIVQGIRCKRPFQRQLRVNRSNIYFVRDLHDGNKFWQLDTIPDRERKCHFILDETCNLVQFFMELLNLFIRFINIINIYVSLSEKTPFRVYPTIEFSSAIRLKTEENIMKLMNHFNKSLHFIVFNLLDVWNT